MIAAPDTFSAATPLQDVIAPAPSKDHLDLATILLDEHGFICDSDRVCEALFGYGCTEMVSRHVSVVLPQLTNVQLLYDGAPNPKLRYLCRIGVQFQGLGRDGERFSCDLFLNRLHSRGLPPLRLLVRRAKSDLSCEAASSTATRSSVETPR